MNNVRSSFYMYIFFNNVDGVTYFPSVFIKGLGPQSWLVHLFSTLRRLRVTGKRLTKQGLLSPLAPFSLFSLFEKGSLAKQGWAGF